LGSAHVKAVCKTLIILSPNIGLRNKTDNNIRLQTEKGHYSIKGKLIIQNSWKERRKGKRIIAQVFLQDRK